MTYGNTATVTVRQLSADAVDDLLFARMDLRILCWTHYWPCRPQSTPRYYGNTSGFWLSPLSRGRWYNCSSYRSMQCFNASPERLYPWRFYSFIGYAEWHPLAFPSEVCQSFKEVLSTLRSVGDVHWARAVASALCVCLVQAYNPQVRFLHGLNKRSVKLWQWHWRCEFTNILVDVCPKQGFHSLN